MNKNDFKRYMQQGLGRCVLTLRRSADIEKYKEIVLWGCLHDLSYDAQCEGSKAAYIYELTTFFKDEEYFIIPTIEAFKKISLRSHRLFSHFCELLQMFAENGNETAKRALIAKYDWLLSAIINKRRFNKFDVERDSFELVCISLTSWGGIEGILKIVEDMGALFKTNTHYDGKDFDWFCSNIEGRFGKQKFDSILKYHANQSENILCFYENYQKSIHDIRNTIRKSIETPSVEDVKSEIEATGKLSHALRVRFVRCADKYEKLKLATEALEEDDLSKKAELLSVFAFSDEAFPLQHEAIIEYSASIHEGLQNVALEVLTNCKSEAVRQYAYKLLDSGEHTSDALQMLLCNYRPTDKSLLLSELYKLKVDYKEVSNWHSIGLKILSICDKNVKLPKEFFIYIYNTTLCSCCRENAVRALAKHRWLTKDVIEECRYDSNCDISKYVNRYYPQK